MPAIREVCCDGWCVRLDLTSQMLHIDVPEHDMDFRRWSGEDQSEPLSPTLPPASDSAVSAATLLLKAKQFDDGLYAAVEIAAQHGLGDFQGKASLLRSLAGFLQGCPEATTSILVASQLGGVKVDVPLALEQPCRQVLQTFLAKQKLSKPLGFYTWTSELSAIFRQDRLLQQPLEEVVANALVAALDRSAELSTIFQSWLRLNARLTNPPARKGLGDAGRGRCFVPASRSHEQVLLERLYSDQPIPDGFDLMSELIRRVRISEIDLSPTDLSGWYDFQTWSLGSLLAPDKHQDLAGLVQSRAVG